MFIVLRCRYLRKAGPTLRDLLFGATVRLSNCCHMRSDGTPSHHVSYISPSSDVRLFAVCRVSPRPKTKQCSMVRIPCLVAIGLALHSQWLHLRRFHALCTRTIDKPCMLAGGSSRRIARSQLSWAPPVIPSQDSGTTTARRFGSLLVTP